MKKKLLVFLLAMVVLCTSFAALGASAETDLTIDFTTLAALTENATVSEKIAVFPAHFGEGSPTAIALGYDVKVFIGTIDLSQYSSATITYATDAGYKAVMPASTQAGVLGFKSSALSFGWENQELNTTDSLGYAETVDASVLNPDAVNWGQNERSLSVDLSTSTYNGPVYLASYNPQGHEIMVTSITFVADNAGDDGAGDDGAGDGDNNPPTNDTAATAVCTMILAAGVALVALKKREFNK